VHRVTLSGRYFVPGPVEVDTDVARAMLQPMIAHRGPDGRALVARIQPGLQALFGTTRPVLMATSSATAMMEAAIRSGVRERVLCIVSGTFGERFADVAERCGKDVVRLHVPRGAVLEAAMLDQIMDGPAVDAVTMIHSETSTGALAPVEALIDRFRTVPDLVTIVDSVSSVGGTLIEFDRWQPDFLFGSSQKALGLPPGLSFGVASERFLERAHEFDDRGFYLDVVDLVRAAEESRFPQTPALPVVYALEAQLQRIAATGLPDRFARHRQMREMVDSWVAGHGRCGIMAPAGRRADTVTALTLAPGRSAIAAAATLAAAGWQVSVGIEEDEDRVLRIGHMGDLQPEQLLPLLDAIEPLL
jgi:aspartate aminotransferase-like enzyme